MALVPGLCPDGQGEPVGLVGRELGPTTLEYFDRFSKRDVSKRVGTSSARTGAVGRLAGGILSNPGGFNRRWSPEVKQAALDLAADIGTEAAARQMEISRNTIASWQTRESRKVHKELQRVNKLVPVAALSWPERRTRLLSALGELAEESVAAARLSVKEGRAKVASDYSNVASRAIDKASLLGGGVTSRSESRSLSVHVDAEKKRALQEEIDELERELEVERKELGDGRS